MGYDMQRKALAKLHAEGELEQVTGLHPFLQFLDRGNPRFNGNTSIMVTQLNLDLPGEVFWLIERNGAGRPFHYWPIPTTWIRELPSAKRPFFTLSFGSLQQDIPIEEMIWFKYPDPGNPYGRGTGTGNALGDELDIDEAAAKYTKSFFTNDATPSLLIGLAGASPEQIKRARNKWDEQHRGFFKSFRTHFFRTKLDVKQLSTPLKDMQLNALRTLERDTIIQNYGVPPEIMGIVTNSNRATIAGARDIMGREVVLPRLEFLKSHLQTLASEFDDRLILGFESPIPDDREFELQVMKTQPGAFEANEVRTMAGKAPKDELEGVHFIPGNVVPTQFDDNGVPTNPQAGMNGGTTLVPANSSDDDDDKANGHANGHALTDPLWARDLQ